MRRSPQFYGLASLPLGVLAIAGAFLLCPGCRNGTGGGTGTIGVPADTTRPADPCAPGDHPAIVAATRTILVDGEPRSFVLDVPRREGSEKLPAVLSYHGIGGDPSSLSEVTGIGERAHMRRFVAVHPEGKPVKLGLRFGHGWVIDGSPNRDVAFTEAIVEALGSEVCLDDDRIYAAGFSNGAHFTHVLACLLPSRIAAFAAVGGGLNLMATGCGDGGPVPAAIIHGRDDKVVGISEGIAAQEFWRKRNAATVMDSAGKTCVQWTDLSGNNPVLYCNVTAVGHWWPLVERGDALDATTVILDFFGLGSRSLVHLP